MLPAEKDRPALLDLNYFPVDQAKLLAPERVSAISSATRQNPHHLATDLVLETFLAHVDREQVRLSEGPFQARFGGDRRGYREWEYFGPIRDIPGHTARLWLSHTEDRIERVMDDKSKNSLRLLIGQQPTPEEDAIAAQATNILYNGARPRLKFNTYQHHDERHTMLQVFPLSVGEVLAERSWNILYEVDWRRHLTYLSTSDADESSRDGSRYHYIRPYIHSVGLRDGKEGEDCGRFWMDSTTDVYSLDRGTNNALILSIAGELATLAQKYILPKSQKSPAD